MSTNNPNDPVYRQPYYYDPATGYQPSTAPVNPEKNGLGIAALICGIIGLLFCLMPITGFIGFALGVVGFILGLAGVARVRKNKATNRKTAWAGVLTSAASIIFGMIGIVMFFSAVDQLGEDLEDAGNDWDQYSECIDANPPEDWDRCDQLDN